VKTVLKATDAASIQDDAAASFVTREVRKISAKAIQRWTPAGKRDSVVLSRQISREWCAATKGQDFLASLLRTIRL